MKDLSQIKMEEKIKELEARIKKLEGKKDKEMELTWNEIYQNADGAGCDSDELDVKDSARYSVVCWVKDNFGYDMEMEEVRGILDSVEEFIDYYTNEFDIVFDDGGNIIKHRDVTIKDKAKELLDFYYILPDRCNKEFDTLDMALNVLKELLQEKTKDGQQ